MKLKAIVENLDDVPAEYQDLYEEKDGKFVLKLENDIREHPSVAALQNAFERQKTENRDLKAKIADLERKVEGLPDDFDPQEYDQLKQRIEELEADDNDGKDKDRDKEEAVNRVREKYEQKLERAKRDREESDRQKDEENAALREQLRNSTISTSLNEAMEQANIDPKFRKAVRAILRDQVKVIDKDGDPFAVVETDLDPEQPLAAYVAEWGDSDEGKIYVGKPVGGGANGNDRRGGGSAKNPWKDDQWNLTEQGRIIKEDRQKADRLAREAGKELVPTR
ncbi:hypothetical protein [Microbaculum marinum]|uniref:Phage minor structural protein GP20 n=1 Tax=Microbaculum marinum TaxID=1764581 RepID=A0AAW9RSH3_9HYPH